MIDLDKKLNGLSCDNDIAYVDYLLNFTVTSKGRDGNSSTWNRLQIHRVREREKL